MLCDDHAIVRAGIRALLERESDISIVAEAASGHEAVTLVQKLQPDLLLLDLSMPSGNGLDAIARIRQVAPRCRVLVLSMHSAPEYVRPALRAGAQGYLCKTGDPAELITAVRTLAQGRKYVTPEVAQMLVESLSSPTQEALHTTLSERELQTLTKIASGKRLSEIAEELMLSPKTVSVYRARVLEKLRLSNNAELTVYAIRNGLV